MTRSGLLAAAFALLIAGPAYAGPGDVVSTKHNLSLGGPGTVKAPGETQVCVFCHTPHNANPAPQLWNHQTSGATTYATYGSSSFDSGVQAGTFNTFAGRSAQQPTGSSRLCLSCHDGTIAVGATLNNGVISVGGANGGALSGPSSLGTDLSNDHGVSFARSGADQQVTDPPAGDPVHLEHQTGYVQCVSCHDAHKDDNDPTTRKFLVKSNSGSAICVTCHVKSGSGWSWNASPHRTSTKAFTSANNGGVAGLGAHTGYATVASNGCESCHKPHAAPQAQRLLKSVSQQQICFQCHGSPVVAQKNIATAFAKTRRHPLESSTASILHDYAELQSSPTNFSGARRHVTCADCHNPHGVANAGSAGSGLHAARTNTISSTSVLAGASGVEPAGWPAVLARSGSFPMASAAQSGYALSASAAREYQICMKCHTSYAFGGTAPTMPSGGPGTDVATEFNAANRSYHPVVGAPHLRTAPSTYLLAPWNATNASTRMYCSDCHGNNEATSASVPGGPHGSANNFILRFTNATWSPTAPTLNSTTGFCFNCHASSSLRSSNSVHGAGAHQSAPCQYCHVAVPHGSFRPGLIALVKDQLPYNRGAAKIRRFQYSSTPGGYQRASCYSDVSPCHSGHNSTSYAPTTNVNTYY